MATISRFATGMPIKVNVNSQTADSDTFVPHVKSATLYQSVSNNKQMQVRLKIPAHTLINQTTRIEPYQESQEVSQQKNNRPPKQVQTKLSTPIKVHILKELIRGYEKSYYLVQGFSEGFKMGVEGNFQSHSFHNHLSVLNDPQAAIKKLQQELDAGRIAGPFNSTPLPKFVISHLGLIPKKEAGEFRLIHDLSFPHYDSVNDHIPKETSHVRYETLDDIVTLVKTNGPGSLIAKADIESAFQIIPIHPGDYHLLGFMWEDKFFYDKCLPMGCSTSCTIFESFSCAIQWVLTNKLEVQYMSHILDDFMFVGPSNSIMSEKFKYFHGFSSKSRNTN